MSPTERSLKHLRELGYVAEVVERWIPGANIRKDLFGCIDIMAISSDGATVGVQATSLSNVSARVTKIANSEHIAAMRRAGWILLVHGWGLDKDHKYRLREVNCS